MHRPLGSSPRIPRLRRSSGAPLKADPFAQLKLLDVQQLDSSLHQLRHQLAHLPEARQLTELATERTGVDGNLRDARTRVEDLTREQRKADSDVEQVKTRRQRDRDRMEAGLVNNPRDLEHMQGELVSLERRIGELEDAELEVMEALEAAQGELTEHQERLTHLDATITETEQQLSEKGDGIGRQIAEIEQERRLTAADLPADLLALYDRLREQKEGVGAAALRARQCGGCRLELNAADLGVIARAPVDEVLRCEECNRILVRTSESGL